MMSKLKRAPSLIEDCTKLTASASHGAIAMASPLQDFIMHLFRLNWTFNLVNTSLLTKSKLACNLETRSASLIQIPSLFNKILKNWGGH